MFVQPDILIIVVSQILLTSCYSHRWCTSSGGRSRCRSMWNRYLTLLLALQLPSTVSWHHNSSPIGWKQIEMRLPGCFPNPWFWWLRLLLKSIGCFRFRWRKYVEMIWRFNYPPRVTSRMLRPYQGLIIMLRPWVVEPNGFLRSPTWHPASGEGRQGSHILCQD